MAWRTRGLRGSTFEEMINRSNDKYNELGLAIVQKIPTPITPIRTDSEKHQITLAYFDQKSTVDYIGAVQGIPVCFDAKETDALTFPMHNIHKHQAEFMKAYEAQDGVAFILIYYTKKNLIYYMRFEELMYFYTRMEEGGRKSFRFDELDERFFIDEASGLMVPYLDKLQLDLSLRD